MNFDKVKEFIIEITGCDAEEITADANLKEDLGMDSLDAMEVAMMIKENLAIEIPEDTLAQIETVKDIVDYLDSVSGK